jgi:pimeloyl-ACP methyl ester carboxylesterase
VKDFFERVPALAGSWFFELPETGHFPMYEQPDEFFKILKRIGVEAI